MSWELTWTGRATDFIPDHLKLVGSPGPVAHLTKAALWEAVQSAGEHNSGAWVNVKATGWENKREPGSGQVTIMVEIKSDYELGDVHTPPSIPETVPVLGSVPLARRGNALASTSPANLRMGIVSSA